MAKRQQFMKEFKLEAVRLWKSSGRPATAVARELGLRRNHLYKWQLELETHGEAAFPGKGGRAHSIDGGQIRGQAAFFSYFTPSLTSMLRRRGRDMTTGRIVACPLFFFLNRQQPSGTQEWQAAIAAALGLETTLRRRGRPSKVSEK